MIADLVALPGYSQNDVWILLCAVSDHEECSANPELSEDVKNAGRVIGMRTVIDGDCDL